MATEKRLIAFDPVTFESFTRHCTKHREPYDQYDMGYVDAVENIENWMDANTVDAVVLPCKIGDKVYRIDKGNYYSNWKPFVQELTVTEISWKKEKHGDKDLGFAIIADGIRYKFTSIGKSVFLTRKEAEAKMDGDGNE